MVAAKRIFLTLFVLFTLTAAVLLLLSSRAQSAAPGDGILIPVTGETGIGEPSSQNSGSAGSLALVSSLFASVTSLVGFVTTTVITWRKEQREASLADVERRKLEMELEKSKLELEEIKKSKKKKRE